MNESLWSECKALARQSVPVALTQMGLMLTGVVDTLMVSRISVDALAAAGLAVMWQWSWVALGLGLVMGIDPIVSQAHGAGDGERAGLAAQRGAALALAVSVPICLAQFYTGEGLRLLGQELGSCWSRLQPSRRFAGNSPGCTLKRP